MTRPAATFPCLACNALARYRLRDGIAEIACPCGRVDTVVRYLYLIELAQQRMAQRPARVVEAVAS